MSTAAAAKSETKTSCPPPFAIEADHHRNQDLAIQCIPGLVLRTRITGTRTVRDAKSGEEFVPTDQARHLGLLPEIPGMLLYVDPAKCRYRVVDPLASDQDLCDKIKRRVNAQTLGASKAVLRGVPEQKGVLDVHRMKSLCWELMHIVRAKEARIISGNCPDEVQVEEMPGNLLLNPGARMQNTQPQFTKDWSAWLEQLNRAGG